MVPVPKLLRELKTFYAKSGRTHLPWRRFDRPLPAGGRAYRVLVSEVMLQQTQVERVVPFYQNFLKKFPTPQALAKAPLSEVLKAWQGLGYNRRGRFLHEAGKKLALAETSQEKVLGSPVSGAASSRARLFSRKVSAPLSTEFLESLPGVGHYTARAVAAFAYNRPEAFVETNIRTVFFHHLFEGDSVRLNLTEKLSDKELLPLVEKALKKSKMEPRDFYAALMDYGSYLKKQGVKVNAKSKHYTKQSKFEGSARQLRGAILRELLKSPATLAALTKSLSRVRGEVSRELLRLVAEGLVAKTGRKFTIAG